VASEVASRPLDRSRPLWELCVVEGLADGHVGFVAKIHHSVADGVKAAQMLATVLQPDPASPEPEPAPWRPEPIPERRRVATRALLDRLRQLLWLPGLVRRTFEGFRNVIRRRRSGAVSPPLPFDAPNLSFNRALTPRRLFASTSISLDDVKEVKDTRGVTVNDVVLALCASALRRWLAGRGELPDRPLVAGVPVSTRSAGRETRANSVSNLFTALPVQEPDPVARLRAIHQVMQGAKEQHNALGAEMLADWSELTPGRPFAAAVRLYSRRGLADRHRPPINVVISNVPGPREPLYVAGARLVGLWSMGPILENVGLNITVWSYLDRLNVGAVACPEAIPDLPRLVGFLSDALEELRKEDSRTADPQ
jgi:diacylglycerol O-acyltransferase